MLIATGVAEPHTCDQVVWAHGSLPCRNGFSVHCSWRSEDYALIHCSRSSRAIRWFQFSAFISTRPTSFRFPAHKKNKLIFLRLHYFEIKWKIYLCPFPLPCASSSAFQLENDSAKWTDCVKSIVSIKCHR